MRDEHLTPLLMACSEAELALLIEFVGRPPSGLLWRDPRLRDPHATREQRVQAVIAEVLRCGDHSVTGRLGGGNDAYLQVLCDVLRELELSEAPASGIAELEQRVVDFVLDTEFERLPKATQDALRADFFGGEFFMPGLHGYGPLHPFLAHQGPGEKPVVKAGKLRRALAKVGGHQLELRVRALIRRTALRLVTRRFAGAIGWAWTAWDVAGPAYRLLVPVICYFAYLRHHQTEAARASAPAQTDAPADGAAGTDAGVTSGSA